MKKRLLAALLCLVLVLSLSAPALACSPAEYVLGPESLMQRYLFSETTTEPYHGGLRFDSRVNVRAGRQASVLDYIKMGIFGPVSKEAAPMEADTPHGNIGVVGGNGAGKSALISILFGIVNEEDQHIINASGEPSRGVTVITHQTMSGRHGYEENLFIGTVQKAREILVHYGSGPLSPDRVNNANTRNATQHGLTTPQVHYFEPLLPESSSPTDLAGGQKQRLSIARALAVKPNIPLFDESAFALDLSCGLPRNDEIKGCTIGRAGRNIRAQEAPSLVDLFIAHTPKTIRGSAAFDPVHREGARLTDTDGRIHSARVEKAFAIQAGREARVMVKSEMTYPGQNKIPVIRETRAIGCCQPVIAGKFSAHP